IAVEGRGVTGGQDGIIGVARPGLLESERARAIARVGLAALATYGFHLLAKSRWGAAMRAVRNSEVAAESVGLDPVRIKTAAFAISAFCAGVAGASFFALSG